MSENPLGGSYTPEDRSGGSSVDGNAGYTATTVSTEDVTRVVARALSAGSRRIRLTYGQRLAIVHAPRPAAGAPG